MPWEGLVARTFERLAREHRCYTVVATYLREDAKRCSSATGSVDRSGKVAGIYRKVHLVPSAGGFEGGTTPGREFPVFECDFGKLGIQICHDMAFAGGWRELARQADEVAAGFARAGVRPGDRVGLLAGNRPAFVTTLAGLLRLGAIAVPMGTRLQTPEIAYILAHCGAVGLVHDEDLNARLPEAADVPALRHRWVEPPRDASAAALGALPARPPKYIPSTSEITPTYTGPSLPAFVRPGANTPTTS